MNDQFSNMMDTVFMIAIISSADSMIRASIAPELERRLGRPLTEWDWQAYRQEKANRDQLLAWNKAMALWRQQSIDRQIIRDFVCEG